MSGTVPLCTFIEAESRYKLELPHRSDIPTIASSHLVLLMRLYGFSLLTLNIRQIIMQIKGQPTTIGYRIYPKASFRREH